VRYWSLLFLVTAALCVGSFLYAMIDPNWWLLQNVSVKSPMHFGAEIDNLFMLVLEITGAVFVLTMLALSWALWRYPHTSGRAAVYSHGNHKLEIVWTLIPALILIFLAIYQSGTWADIKFRTRKPKSTPLAQVTGRQFNWVMRYPGADGKFGTTDDLHVMNNLHIVKDQAVLIDLKSQDVLHSFFLPQIRLKQDAVPGMTVPVWFDVDTAGTYELVCAELCGWGHYKMRGLLTVHETQEEFNEWMKSALAEQNRTQPPGAALPESDAGEPATAATSSASIGEKS